VKGDMMAAKLSVAEGAVLDGQVMIGSGIKAPPAVSTAPKPPQPGKPEPAKA
jgi:hypothetical protein